MLVLFGLVLLLVPYSVVAGCPFGLKVGLVHVFFFVTGIFGRSPIDLFFIQVFRGNPVIFGFFGLF